LFFSRTLVDPQFGLRMTGKIGSWALGLLASDDRAPGRLVPTDDLMSDQRADVGMFRVQREVGAESAVGFLFSRRRFGTSSNEVLSVDTRLKLSANWFFTGQAVHSRAVDLIGDRFSGFDGFAEVRHSGLHLNYSTAYLDRSPNLRVDLGFIPRVDIRQLKNDVTYQWRPEHGSLISLGPSLNTRVIWDHRGQLQEGVADAAFTFTFKGPTSFSVGRLEELETFQDIAFRENGSYVYFSTQKLKWMGVDATYTRGTDINFFPAAGMLPFLGNSDDATAGITFRPTSRLRIDETYLYDRLGAMDRSQQATVFNNHLLRTKFNYQFTRALSVRAIVDYDATLPNESLVDLERSKQLTGDLLFTYLVHPGTAFYVGYTDRRENFAFDPENPAGSRRTGFPGFPTGQQLFVKISYLLKF
jgi:hypothetical protein